MKNLKTLAMTSAVLNTVVLAFSGAALAGSPGQLAGGDNYLVKNVTKGGSYSNSVSASCGDELKYSMQLSNTQFGGLNNVILKATLPTNGGVSTATATTDLGGASGTSDTASVSLPNGATQSLINGTTVLYDGNATAIKTLPDTIVNGVNIGTLTGSTTEFVNFKVKVTCQEQPPVSTGVCKAADVKTYDKTRKVEVTVSGSVNNATIVDYKIDFGDGTVVNSQTASHTYAKDGSYRIVASVLVKYADGNSEWKTADACAKNVKFESTTPPVVTPPTTTTTTTPTAMPETGAGSVVAIFVVVSSVAALGYNVLSRRIRA